MNYKTIRLLFLLFFFITSYGAYSQDEAAGKYSWPDLSKHSAYSYKRYPCGFNAMYYLLQRLECEAKLNDNEKELLLNVPEITSFNHMRKISRKIGVPLQGFQVNYNEFSFPIMLTILDVENGENHYVVVEKIENNDQWLVTDWPNARYILSSNELQKLTKELRKNNMNKLYYI